MYTQTYATQIVETSMSRKRLVDFIEPKYIASFSDDKQFFRIIIIPDEDNQASEEQEMIWNKQKLKKELKLSLDSGISDFSI